MANFPTRIPDCDSHSPPLLDSFFSSDASICSTIALPPLKYSDHIVISVSIDFPSHSKQDAPFHCIAYNYSCANWGGLCDHLRDVPEIFFNLSASVAASELCDGFKLEVMYIYINISGQASLVSMAFSCLYCCHSS